jgi:succinoglycan biosynthesis protein ExoA
VRDNVGDVKKSSGDELPFVSVLVAARNDGRYLERCLSAIRSQDYPALRLEVVIADGRSTDGTPALIRQFASGAPFDVHIIDNPEGGAASGFNAALRAAAGDVIVLLGARAMPEPDFVSASVRVLAESGADAVGGVVSGAARGLQAETVALALGSRFGVGDARYRFASVASDVDTVNYGAYRREVFAELGGFDETMANVEDDEFNYRLREAGKRLYLSPEIRCSYLVRPSVMSLLTQYGRYGYPKIRVLLRHPGQMRPRQFAPAALMAALGLTLLGSRRFSIAGRIFWFVAASYSLASAIASIRLAHRRGWRYLPLLPVAFAAMHGGYGVASLAGAVRFGLPALLPRRQERGSIPRELGL